MPADVANSTCATIPRGSWRLPFGLRTPPENVDALANGFAHHAHVVATNTGHEARELPSDAFRTLLAAFLSGEQVESTTVELPPPPFGPIEPAR